MTIDPNAKIKLECHNWYEIEGEILKICMRNGHTILLKSDYRTVWLAIGYGVIFSELVEKIQESIPEKVYWDILQQLNALDLIVIIQPEDEFDLIFN